MGGSDFSGGWVGCTVSCRTQPRCMPTLAHTAVDADRRVCFRRGIYCGVSVFPLYHTRQYSFQGIYLAGN